MDASSDKGKETRVTNLYIVFNIADIESCQAIFTFALRFLSETPRSIHPLILIQFLATPVHGSCRLDRMFDPTSAAPLKNGERRLHLHVNQDLGIQYHLFLFLT